MGKKIEWKPSERRLDLGWLPLAWLSFFFVGLIFGFIEGSLDIRLEEIVLRLGISNVGIFALMMCEIGMIIAVAILLYLMRRRDIGLDAIGLRGGLSLKGVLYAILGVMLSSFLYNAIEGLFKAIGWRMLWREEWMRIASPLDFLLLFTGAIILAPSLEEILYRGYVLTALRERMRTFSALVLASLIFASVHVAIGPGIMVFIFFWAFIPSLLFLKFGNLYPSMLMHALNNLVPYILMPLHVIE
jgi:hypothetical protein